MGQFAGEEKYLVAEPAEINDIFAVGIHHIQVFPPNVRFLLYAPKPALVGYESSEARALVDPAVVMPIEAIPSAIQQIVFALGRYWGKEAHSMLKSLFLPI